MHVWVAHGAGSDYALISFRTKGTFQELRCILLHFYIFKIVGEVVAFASAVAVNAAVGAAAIEIHTVVGR